MNYLALKLNLSDLFSKNGHIYQKQLEKLLYFALKLKLIKLKVSFYGNS